MTKDFGSQAYKWAVAIVAVFVIATIGVALLPLITTQFASNGALLNSSCAKWNSTCNSWNTTNTTPYCLGSFVPVCTSNELVSFWGVVPTVLIIAFVVSLIIGVIALLKYGKHR